MIKELVLKNRITGEITVFSVGPKCIYQNIDPFTFVPNVGSIVKSIAQADYDGDLRTDPRISYEVKDGNGQPILIMTKVDENANPPQTPQAIVMNSVNFLPVNEEV